MKEEDKTLVLQNTEVGEDYSSLPTRKPDVVKKGKLIGWNEEGVYHFAARVARPDLQQEVLLKKKDLKVAKTRGEKESTIILTCKVDANCADPYGQMLSMVHSELGDKAKKAPKPVGGSCLYEDGDHLRIWHKKKEKKLAVMIELDMSVDKNLAYKDVTECVSKIFQMIDSTKF